MSLDTYSPALTSSDDVAHMLDGTCWCQPVVDYEDPITGGRVYVHRATIDGRAYETADSDDGSVIHEEHPA